MTTSLLPIIKDILGQIPYTVSTYKDRYYDILFFAQKIDEQHSIVCKIRFPQNINENNIIEIYYFLTKDEMKYMFNKQKAEIPFLINFLKDIPFKVNYKQQIGELYLSVAYEYSSQTNEIFVCEEYKSQQNVPSKDIRNVLFSLLQQAKKFYCNVLKKLKYGTLSDSLLQDLLKLVTYAPLYRLRLNHDGGNITRTHFKNTKHLYKIVEPCEAVKALCTLVNYKSELPQMLSSNVQAECRQLIQRHECIAHWQYQDISRYLTKDPFTGKIQNAIISVPLHSTAICVRIEACTRQEYTHQQVIIKQIIKKEVPQIPTYLFQHLNQTQRIIILREDCTPLQEYLNTNELDLSSRLQIMKEISFLMLSLHDNKIGMFLKMSNLIVNSSGHIMLYNLTNAYSVTAWADDFGPMVQEEVKCMAKQQDFPHILYSRSELQNDRCDVYSLGTVLYRVLIGKYPFNVKAAKAVADKFPPERWRELWTVQTEVFEGRGGIVAKLLSYLILRCMSSIERRPYLEWLPAIFSYVRNNLYA